MISGEWSVLEGHSCIVAAVNKRSECTIEESDKLLLTIPEFNIEKQEINLDQSKSATRFIVASLNTCKEYLNELKPMHITTESNSTKINNKKIGLGSSAAITVATIAAILKYHDEEINKDLIFKLASISHYKAQGKLGSCFDIAASTYGNVISYTPFNSEWLLEQVNSKTIKEIVQLGWPNLNITPLNNIDLDLKIGWTGDSASTSEMIKQMNEWPDKEEHKRIIQNISDITQDLIKEWQANNTDKILTLIKANEELLRELTKQSKVNIETPELKLLSDLANKHGAGKLSGAGGGDCGIALTKENQDLEKDWISKGITPLTAKIDPNGVL